MNVIYVDELFFLNALTDYLLLLSCARLRGRALRRTRFAAAAALGGVYAVFAAIPPLSFLVSLAVKALVSLLMAWIAFGAPPELWRGWGCFLALSSAFAGAVYGISLLSGAEVRGVLSGASLKTLALSFGLCYAAVLAVIVCKDAMGVRLETGKQAAIINEIVRAFDELSSGKLTDVKLKEFVGHTPIQVLAGILLGIVNAVLLHLFIFP